MDPVLITRGRLPAPGKYISPPWEPLGKTRPCHIPAAHCCCPGLGPAVSWTHMGLHAHTQGNPVTEHMVPTAWSHWPFPSWEAWSRGLGAAGIRKGYPHRGSRGPAGRGSPSVCLQGRSFHSRPGRRINTSSVVRRRENNLSVAGLCPRATSCHSRNSPRGLGNQESRRQYRLQNPRTRGHLPLATTWGSSSNTRSVSRQAGERGPSEPQTVPPTF